MSADGTFRRRVSIATRSRAEGIEARCAVEDDFHHFRVHLEAHSGVISAVRTVAIRSPNTLCEAAGHQLTDLLGMALDPACAAVLKQTDQFQQCTHQLDLAGLGVAAMALERPRCTYDVTVPDRQDGRTNAMLEVDGEPILQWTVTGMTIESPAPFAGRSLGAGFTAFTRSLGRDEAEAALVLRRAVFVSQGRGIDIAALGERGPIGGCWAWQPERSAQLQRLPANRRHFSPGSAALLTADKAWLDFSA